MKITSARTLVPTIVAAALGLLLVGGCAEPPGGLGDGAHGAAGVSGGKVGKVYSTGVTGDPGQCTYYAELAWFTYSDPLHSVSPGTIHGNGQDVAASAAQAYGGSVETTPRPGSLVSFSAAYMGEAQYGHVAFVVAADNQSFTVWEMNWGGPFKVNRRVVPFTGPTPGVSFFWPPNGATVDPEAIAPQQFGSDSWWCTAQDCVTSSGPRAPR